MSRQKTTLKKVCLYLDAEMLEKLQQLKEEDGVPVSVSVRKAVEIYVKEKRRA